MLNYEQLRNKWESVLVNESVAAIKDSHRMNVTAALLENQEKALNEQKAATAGFLAESDGTTSGSIVSPDPVMIALVRRAMPALIAYDVCGVQPMTGPTGLIFAMKARLGDGDSAGVDNITASSPEALFNEADSQFTGPMTTAAGEGDVIADMGFSIHRVSVTAKTRALRAEFTAELAQDLKAMHGLDAESELANILSQEILAEINREIINKLKAQAKTGANAGTFDLQVDADGRWAVEKFQSLLFEIEKECNTIAKETRRGKGNWIICDSNVASALAATGRLNTAGVGDALAVDPTQNTYAGNIGNIKVYVDAFAAAGSVVVGYRGTNPYDAGYFYAPYVPLTMVRAVGENDFQPKIAFKTRYGVSSNPLLVDSDAQVADGSNTYFRKFNVTNINLGES